VGEVLVGGLLVIAGGLLTFAGGYWIQTRQWKREDEYRDYADRRQAYLEFVASWHSYEEAQTRTPPDQRVREEADLKIQRNFNALSLIAPEEVRAAADDVRKWSDRDRRVPDEDPGAPGRFWKAARKDLGKWPPR
jgi:hypothetical protein